MLFNSLSFALFFAVVLAVYWNIPLWSQKLRVLLVASLLFYATWNPPFLLLLLLTMVVDYTVALAIERSPKGGKVYLLFSLAANLGVLATFKYADFVLENYAAAVSFFTGRSVPARTLGLVLPMGISFYTFQSMAYTIEVYRRKVRAIRAPLEYGVFITFFPQLIAGPIVRPDDLAPQVASERPRPIFDEFYVGCTRIVFGLSKKVLLADWLAAFVEPVFGSPAEFTPTAVGVAVLAYAFQIYFDFSGYSDIAIGCAALLGFKLPENFKTPYLSQSITEFWRRWHITLSFWLRDYLYIPLGGNRGGAARTYLNQMITMVLGGLWHGASWNFVIWGGAHGALLGLHKWATGSKSSAVRLPGLAGAWRTLLTFLLVSMIWVFFRAASLEGALAVLGGIGRLVLSPLHLVAFLGLAAGSLAAYRLAHEVRERLERFRPSSATGLALTGASLGIWLLVLAVFAGPTTEFIYFQF